MATLYLLFVKYWDSTMLWYLYNRVIRIKYDYSISCDYFVDAFVYLKLVIIFISRTT